MTKGAGRRHHRHRARLVGLLLERLHPRRVSAQRRREGRFRGPALASPARRPAKGRYEMHFGGDSHSRWARGLLSTPEMDVPRSTCPSIQSSSRSSERESITGRKDATKGTLREAFGGEKLINQTSKDRWPQGYGPSGGEFEQLVWGYCRKSLQQHAL